MGVSRIRASASAVIDAAPAVVYAILADYRDGHPRILPPAYFGRLVVDEGGVGAGTRIRVEVRMPAQTRVVAMEVTEPEPGRVLREQEIGGGPVTTFTVDAADDGRRASVSIETSWERRGVQAVIERWLAPALLRRVYAAQFRRLETEAKRRIG